MRTAHHVSDEMEEQEPLLPTSEPYSTGDQPQTRPRAGTTPSYYPERLAANQPTALARPPKRRALLIGICYDQCEGEDGVQTLKGPHKDVERMRSLLLEFYAYKAEDITVMMDSPEVIESLQPTKANLTREISSLVQDCWPGDRFVFTFSGHSDQRTQKPEENENLEEDGMDECIVTVDRKKIRDNKLYQWLVKPLVAGSGLFALIDSCHSGTMLDLPHYKCNAVYVPWVSKGTRRSGTMRMNVVRRLAALNSTGSNLASNSYVPSITEVIERQDVTHPHTTTAVRSITEGSKLSLNTRVNALASTSSAAPHTTRRGNSLPHQIFDEVLVASPVCESPQSNMACQGWCLYNNQWKKHHADVVSLSACTDMQRAWEDGKGRSLVPLFCEYIKHSLRRGQHPTYHDIMHHLSYKLYNNSVKVHEWTLKEKRLAKQRGTSSPDGEFINFQTPELSSLSKLDLKAPFDM